MRVKKNLCILMSTVFALICFASCAVEQKQERTITYDYQAANLTNPLRGLAVWNTSKELPFKYSLEYLPIPLDKVYDESGAFDFSYCDEQLDKIARRGNQVILRFVAWEPPSSYLPDFYIANGVQTVNVSASGSEYIVPDFSDATFISLLTELISELGNRFDGDSRIAFLQLGLMGRWGEWNYSSDYPTDKRPTNEQYNQIYAAFDDAFSCTKLMARNPNMGNAKDYQIGFHDDSFMFSTLGSGSGDFKYLCTKGGIDSELWKTQAFGSELAGYEEGDFFSTEEKRERFLASVRYMNFSFMLWQKYTTITADSTLLAMKDEFMSLSRELGYELSVTECRYTFAKGQLDISVTLKNTGNAPFYYDWEGKIEVCGKDGLVRSDTKKLPLSSIMPNDSQSFDFSIDDIDSSSLERRVTFEIINPMSLTYDNAKKFFLANSDKDMTDNRLNLFTL